jgi:hypothetical protein
MDEGGVAMVVPMVVVFQEVPYVREEPAHVQEEGIVAVDRAAGPQSHVLAVGWTRSWHLNENQLPLLSSLFSQERTQHE